jgi:N-carbamoylputrescine amidase
VNLRTAYELLPSPARAHAPSRPPFRVGVVQFAWNPDPAAHDAAIGEAVRAAAGEGARLVCLPELTRSPYFAIERRDPDHPRAAPEQLPGGPTYELVARCAQETGAYVHASLYEDAGDGGLGYNTAFVVSPDG